MVYRLGRTGPTSFGPLAASVLADLYRFGLWVQSSLEMMILKGVSSRSKLRLYAKLWDALQINALRKGVTPSRRVCVRALEEIYALRRIVTDVSELALRGYGVDQRDNQFLNGLLRSET